ncbi:MAG: hypothetical protein HYZ57_20585 [Acidobacteria bacterium]|nr:hypothetical protein [Acidobacteriota bacterium]MBI3282224.1 hypothetical protein [Acidobacteriota bacterium]
MNKPRSKAVLERGAVADLWRHTLSHIPAMFGRLVYLSSLRNIHTGKYEHHGLSLVFGDLEADRALRRSHAEAFNEWLDYSLEQQKADLALYLSSLAGDRRSIVDNWARLQPYRNFVPASAREVERRLYLSDFETLLHILKTEFGLSRRDED